MTAPEEQYTETARTVIHRFEDRDSAPYLLTALLSETTDRGRTYYSITVIARTDEGTQSACTVPDITDNPKQAEWLFRLIADGGVMPCTLEDVISDLLG